MQAQNRGEPSAERQGRERLIALVLLGALLFNYPILRLFGVEYGLFGIPLLFVYVFAAWGLFIALVARVVDRSVHDPKESRD